MLWNDKPYHSLDYEMKKQYGEKVYKLSVNAGMTCPNRDGTLGVGGCIFCSEGGSGDFAARGESVREQLKRGRTFFRGKNVGRLFIAYFQAFTNTYAPVDRLEALYREALDVESVAGISIATRPDCLGDEVLALLERLKAEYADKFIWVELGLQTTNEAAALLIRRGYKLSVFDDAVKSLRGIGIPIIAHVILGLPYETRADMLATCKYLADMRIDGVKLQLLHVLKNTPLAELYERGAFETLGFDEYIDIVISCLEIIPPDTVIHRVTGDGARKLLIAPLWSTDKRRVLNTLHGEMKRRGTFQGIMYPHV